MSLFDIDKTNNKRGEPRPNQVDQQNQRMAHNTMGNTNRQDGDNNNQRMAFKNGIILWYDGENRVSSVYGYIPDLVDYPVQITALAGYDVYEDLLGLTPPAV